MIGMGIAGQTPHSQIPISRSLDPPAGENPIGITIDQQGQHHRGRVLGIAGAPLIDHKLPSGHGLDRFNDKMYQLILRYPIPQVSSQEHRRIAIDFDKSFRHPWLLTEKTFS
jgi:hypothetical protein